jgi:hypothetical protein
MEIAIPVRLVVVAPKNSSCGFLDGVSMWL